MNECNVDMKAEEGCDVDLKMDVEVVTEVPIPVPVGYSHDRLYDRELPDQHPIKAITDLQNRLDEKVNKEVGKDLMTDAEREKLDGIEAGSQVNKIEVIKVNGELIPVSDKTVDIVQDFAGELTFDLGSRELSLLADDGTILSTVIVPGEQSVGDEVTIHVNGDVISVHPDLLAEIESTETGLGNHIIAQDNPHKVTKAQVGLGSVDNTADKDKPVSTATQAALDLKADQTELDKTNIEVGKKANQSALDATNDALTAKADDAGVVHKAGKEIITGEKAFEGFVSIKNGFIPDHPEKPDTPIIGFFTSKSNKAEEIDSWSRYSWIKTFCKGGVSGEIVNDGDGLGTSYVMSTVRNIKGSDGNYTQKSQAIGVRILNDGKGYAFAPPTPSGSNGTEIVTAGYLNTASTVVHTTGNETVAGNKDFTGKVTVPAPSADANGLEIVTAGWANGKYVGLSGDQVIVGYKTFAKNPRIGGHADPVLYLTATASPIEFSKWNRHGRIDFTGDLEVDGVTKQVAVGEIVQNQDATRSSLDMSVIRVDENGKTVTASTVGPKIGTVDKVPYATASYRTANQSSTDIVTFGMVPTLTDIVHTTGNQTIAGEKEFTAIVRERSGLTLEPTGFGSGGYYIVDPTGKDFVARYSVEGNTDYSRANMSVYRKINGVTKECTMRIVFNSDGTTYVDAPWRASGWTNGDVVTYGMLKKLGLIKE